MTICLVLLLPDTRSPKREAFRTGGYTGPPPLDLRSPTLAWEQGAGDLLTHGLHLACSAHIPCWPFQWLVCTENGYFWPRWLKMEVEIWNVSSVCDEASILLNSHNCLHKICMIPGQLTPCHGSGGSWGLRPPCRFISSYQWTERGRGVATGTGPIAL